MTLAALILSGVSLLIAGVALGLVLALRRRSGLGERLMGMTRKEFKKFKDNPEEFGFYRLETIFTEFKKAVATTQQESARHAKERPKIAYGERSTHTIQNLEVSLKGRIVHVPDPTPASSDVRVAFTGEPEEMSELRFTVSTVPPRRTVPGAAIFFALGGSQLTPDRKVKIDSSKPLRVALTGCNADGDFLYNHRVKAAFYRCGKGPDAADTLHGETEDFTNSQGQVEVSFDWPEGAESGTYRIHAELMDATGNEPLKKDDYYFEALKAPEENR